MSFNCAVVVCAILCFSWSSAQLTTDRTKLLNWCLNSTSHKNLPGKEDALHNQCTPWKEKACCTPETTKTLHEGDMHNFNLNHCFNETGKNLSDKCRTYFNQDNCFYECEPHIGFWVVTTKRKIATERFQNVPLCASECAAWFEACKDDYTCAYNWPRNFRFKNGVNYCPEKAKCQTFKHIYENAEVFCENVWDHSWKVTPDNQPCMKMWFNDPLNNPNKAIAEYYITKKFGNHAESVFTYPQFLFLSTALLSSVILF